MNRKDEFQAFVDEVYAEEDEDDLISPRYYRQRCLENSSTEDGENYRCARCGRLFPASEMHADHIMPQSKNGDSTRYNLQLLCRHCNCSKQDDTSDTEADLLRRKNEIDDQRLSDGDWLRSVFGTRR